MYVKLEEDGSIFLRGSLASMLYGNNLQTLTYSDLKASINHLVEQFGIDPSESLVRRLDMAATMEMPRAIPYYINILGVTPRFKPIIVPGESIKYTQTNKAILIYDKGKKEKETGNYLRAEVQYQRQLNKLGFSNLKLSDLINPKVYEVLVYQWLNEVLKIERKRRHIIEPVTGKTALLEQYARIQLPELGGAENQIAIIDSWDIPKQEKGKHRKLLRSLERTGNSKKDQTVSNELDEALLNAAHYALSGL